MNKVLTVIFSCFASIAIGQQGYWQQEVKYTMDIDFDAENHQFKGYQVIDYTNNSPDTLERVFYHLYFNAFQPGSMMDERSRTIQDPDPRVGDRIAALTESEIGYQKINSLTQDGQSADFFVEGTILEVDLARPLLPGQSTKLEMKFEAQVPIQVRRSGRDNAEGVDFSMTQWYPKLAEYDYMGWHANPYIGREFHSIWGDFDVTIDIDASYVIGATGVLQNPTEIGHGYQPKDMRMKKKKGKLKWHFIAENVIDFAWAADPDYNHISKIAHDGTMMRFIYQPGDATSENWARLPKIMDEALKFMNENYGKYQFPGYTFIQGGDGGMEYPMITLITGERSLNSLVGVSVHEWMHSWYQFTLATNESLYAWMDEGFTSFASAEVMNHLTKQGLIPGQPSDDPHIGNTMGYAMFTQSGMEEPLSIHSDHFVTNTAYSRASYGKGSVFLSQLEYVIGSEPFRRGLLRYYNTWKFKHPQPIDIIRIMEKESGLELDWYLQYFVNTTKTIDYGIQNVRSNGAGGTTITLERIGEMPMPIDIQIRTTNGKQRVYHIPMRIMRGEKTFPAKSNVKVEADWPWTHRTYEFDIKIPIKDLESVLIDPSRRMADIVPNNNEQLFRNK